MIYPITVAPAIISDVIRVAVSSLPPKATVSMVTKEATESQNFRLVSLRTQSIFIYSSLSPFYARTAVCSLLYTLCALLGISTPCAPCSVSDTAPLCRTYPPAPHHWRYRAFPHTLRIPGPHSGYLSIHFQNLRSRIWPPWQIKGSGFCGCLPTYCSACFPGLSVCPL